MKKIIYAMLPLLFIGACKKDKDFTALNTNPKAFSTVPAASLFTQAERVLTNTLTSSNVNLNIFRLIVQHWNEVTYTDEMRYDLATRAIPDGLWNTLYRDVLNNLQLCAKNIPTDATIASSTIAKNDAAVVDILSVYTWYYLITTYGNVPYSQAFDPTTTFPKYDSAPVIMADLVKRIDADIAALNTTAGSFGSADPIYAGNTAKWKAFATSFKLKMGITMADYDAAAAKVVIESAAAGTLFASNADNAKFAYLGSTPNTNPIYVDLIQSGRNDFGAAKPIIDNLVANNDPRLPKYFTVTGASTTTGLNPGVTTYSGSVPGNGAGFGTVSHVAVPITAQAFPGLLLDYAETEFNLAEASERGFTVIGTAALHYTNAVTASITYWGGTTTDAATYLAQPAVAYPTATGTYKQKIGTQKWLSDYNRGWDAYIEVRRLDFPVLALPTAAKSGFPNRFLYPVAETNVNGTQKDLAATAIGGDKVETKLFFDKF
ncbi:MAG: SusD/RagB family nutrient-binding outer membrane lipoprotein [Bacteroidota bacterium]